MRAAFAIPLLLIAVGCAEGPESSPLNSSAVVKRVSLARSWSIGTSSVTALAWSSGDQVLQIGTLDGKTRCLRVDETRPAEEWTLSIGRPTCVWDGPGNNHGAADGFGRIWCDSRPAFHHFEFAPALFGSACVSIESARIAAMEDDRRLGIWSLPGLRKLDEIPMGSAEACGLAFGEEGSVLWVGDGKRVRAICPNGRTYQAGTINPGFGLARVVAPVPGDRHVAVGTSEGYVLVFSCDAEVMPLTAKADFCTDRNMPFSIKAIAPIPGTTLLAVATTGGAMVQIWNFATGKTVREFSLGRDEPVSALAMSEDGSALACGFRSGKIAVFRISLED